MKIFAFSLLLATVVSAQAQQRTTGSTPAVTKASGTKKPSSPSASEKVDQRTSQSTTVSAQETPEQVVQRQLNAYNARDLEAFVATYDEQIELLGFPAQPQAAGKAKLRENYGSFFAATPKLHCEIIHRVVLGKRVIDHEKVTGLANGQVLEAVAIYEVENGLIRRVTFVK